jgi:uncharacterized coiled-coil protein SlyX
VRGKAKRASEAIGLILDAVYEWEAKADKFIATGSDDDDVIATHDSRGRLIECTLRPGLQQELTVGELEDCINEAIRENVARAQAGLDKLSAEFQAKCEQAAALVGQHPVGDELVDALARGDR